MKLRLAAVALLLAGIWCLAQAQVPLTHAGKGAPGGGATTTTWNPSDLVNITLSGSNLIATSGSLTNDGSVRSVASHSSGKYYSEYTLTAGGGVNDTACGIANGSTNLSTSPNSTLLVTAHYAGSGTLWINGSNVATPGAVSATNVVGSAIDIGGQLYWTRVGTGNWNGIVGADPAMGMSGKSISGFSGPYFPWCSAAPGQSDAWTANFGATAYTNAAPSGYVNW